MKFFPIFANLSGLLFYWWALEGVHILYLLRFLFEGGQNVSVTCSDGEEQPVCCPIPGTVWGRKDQRKQNYCCCQHRYRFPYWTFLFMIMQRDAFVWQCRWYKFVGVLQCVGSLQHWTGAFVSNPRVSIIGKLERRAWWRCCPWVTLHSDIVSSSINFIVSKWKWARTLYCFSRCS